MESRDRSISHASRFKRFDRFMNAVGSDCDLKCSKIGLRQMESAILMKVKDEMTFTGGKVSLK